MRGSLTQAGRDGADGCSLSDEVGVDLMDGSWLNTTQAREFLGVSRERLRQLAVIGDLPVLPTPYGPLFRLVDLQARREYVAEQFRRPLLAMEFCRGRDGSRHPMTPENTRVARVHGREVLRCKTCHDKHIREWEARNPERAREYQLRAKQKYLAKKRAEARAI